MASRFIEVSISHDQMKGFIKVNPPSGQPLDLETPTPTVEQLLGELRAQGVAFGIKKEMLEALARSQYRGERVLVAAGVAPLPGEPGRIEYFFDTNDDPRPQPLENGKVDYREIGIVHIVNQGDLLARLVPPTAGVPGTTILGTEVPAPSGTPAQTRPGNFTSFNPENPQELKAQVTGSVSLVRNSVQVAQTYTVKSDVDFSRGNIDFPGDVLIYGDIKPGFRVQAGGKIEVRGIVEDAFVEAEGDVLVKGGFEGSGRGLIRSRGAIHLKFVENQSVEAEGPVHIGESALNARIVSGDYIYLNTGLGAAIGGYLQAKQGIQAKVIGNDKHVFTTVEVLNDRQKSPKLLTKEHNVALRQGEIERLQLSLTKMQELKELEATLVEDLKSRQLVLQRKLNGLKAKLDNDLLDLETLRGDWDRDRAGKIEVSRLLHPGTRAIIHGKEYTFQTAVRRATLRREDLEALARPPEVDTALPSPLTVTPQSVKVS